VIVGGEKDKDAHKGKSRGKNKKVMRKRAFYSVSKVDTSLCDLGNFQTIVPLFSSFVHTNEVRHNSLSSDR